MCRSCDNGGYYQAKGAILQITEREFLLREGRELLSIYRAGISAHLAREVKLQSTEQGIFRSLAREAILQIAERGMFLYSIRANFSSADQIRIL